MSRFVTKAEKNRFSLCVSIPRNHPDMAAAAEAGGADGLKVHLNVKHPASGHVFGNFARERKNIESVLKKVALPVGVVPGAEKKATLAELHLMSELGIDFFDIFAHDMPLDYLQSSLGKMVCIDGRYYANDLKRLADLGAQVFEASVIPHEGYGKPIAFSDLVRWKELTANLDIPLLVSTQRKINPDECRILQEIGVRGVMIGVVVTGETAKGVEAATRAFRNVIEAL